ncbi:MAG TPA: ABC transporter ATP-binding protein, partial [Blastococcus sp.]
MSALTVEDLTKSFTTTPVLTGVDLHVPTGSLTALLGPSGCGKTTLLRLIAGFDDPDSGTVRIGNRLVAGSGRSVAARRRGIGFVPQEGGLFPHLTVAGNVAFGLPRRLRRDAGRIRELLALVGLDADLAGRSPHQLSGGQQQRVGVARALAVGPNILLMDEPFGALDAIIRGKAQDDLLAIQRQFKTTIVLVTHDMDEAFHLGDKIAVLDQGRLVQFAEPAELVAHPADEFVARLTG